MIVAIIFNYTEDDSNEIEKTEESTEEDEESDDEVGESSNCAIGTSKHAKTHESGKHT
jgi:hypothetical protein